MRIVRGIAGLLGELLITIGVVLVLFVGWQLFWTDVVSDVDAGQVVTTIEKDPAGPEWVQPKQARLGDAFAIVRIPRFGAKFARPLYEGTTRDVLMRGIGHYADTSLPGDVGNFAVAGHRTTYGKPFNQIDKLVDGDVVLVETRDTYFVYRVTEPPDRAADPGVRAAAGARRTGSEGDRGRAHPDQLPSGVQRAGALRRARGARRRLPPGRRACPPTS